MVFYGIICEFQFFKVIFISYFGYILVFQVDVQKFGKLIDFCYWILEVEEKNIVEIVDKCSFKKLKFVNDIIKDYFILDIGEKFIVEKIKEFMYRKGKVVLILKQ